MRLACGRSARDDDAECKGEPVAIVFTEQEVWHAGDVREIFTVPLPLCPDHLPEGVHEIRSCWSEDEFVIVEIKTNATPTL